MNDHLRNTILEKTLRDLKIKRLQRLLTLDSDGTFKELICFIGNQPYTETDYNDSILDILRLHDYYKNTEDTYQGLYDIYHDEDAEDEDDLYFMNKLRELYKALYKNMLEFGIFN